MIIMLLKGNQTPLRTSEDSEKVVGGRKFKKVRKKNILYLQRKKNKERKEIVCDFSLIAIDASGNK